MSESASEGRVIVGTMHGFSGSATGLTPKIARRNVYQASGLYDASSLLTKNALTWDCDDGDELRTGLSVTPEPLFVREAATGLWRAELHDATLKVWVERFRLADRRFEQRGFTQGEPTGKVA